jgi:hypothetical protein
MGPNSTLLALGDSVVWGQGLQQKDKFCYLVGSALGSEVKNLAHSGATVLSASATESMPPITNLGYASPAEPDPDMANGEVPRSKPTILEQCEYYPDDPTKVVYILLDGGINDVQITTIVNPTESLESLDKSIMQHCYREMLVLLKCVASKFTNPRCRILVTGYYPIFRKPQGDADMIRLIQTVAKLLGHDFEVEKGRRDFNLWESDPVERSTNFWHHSTDALKQAINETRDPRICFVDSGFSLENALFAPDTTLMLWDLNVDFSAKDPMKNARKPKCDMYEPQDFLYCPRASFGHPNQKGAALYLSQIKASLGLP